jgi:hypothetical protein
VLACSILACIALIASLWTTGCGPNTTASERLTDFTLACCVVAAALVEALGLVGWLRPWPLLAASAFAAGVSLACGARRDLAARVEDVRAGIRAVRRSIALKATCALGVALSVRALALREVSWDGLLYHLTYPAVWLQRGGFTAFEAPGVWEQYQSFPKGGETLFALAMLPFGSDGLVYFVQPPLWLATGVAVRATALGLGASRQTADFAVLCALACPGLAAYVAPANLEVLVAFVGCAAIAAASRALRARDPHALASLWLALCWGAAIKITSLAYLPLGVLVTLFCLRSQPLAACAKQSVRGLALGIAVMLPWYLDNLVRCGNPLYPAGLPWAQTGPAAGSLANAWALRESSVMAQHSLTQTIDALARAPWHVRYAGPGWLLLWVAPLSAVSAVLGALRAPRSARLRAALILAALASGMCLLYVLTPWNGVFFEANNRFLMPALLAALLSTCASSSLLTPPLTAAVWYATSFVALATLAMPQFWGSVAWVGLPGAVVLGSCVAFATSRYWLPTQRAHGAGLGVAWVSAALVAALGVASWRALDSTAYARWFTTDAALAQLWRTVDALPPSRIAYVVGGVNESEGWSFYPLFGAKFQHSVAYVDTERIATPVCQRRGLLRDRPDASAWLARIRELRIDYVVRTGRPYEVDWIEARRDAFEPLLQIDTHAIYRVHADALSK